MKWKCVWSFWRGWNNNGANVCGVSSYMYLYLADVAFFFLSLSGYYMR